MVCVTQVMTVNSCTTEEYSIKSQSSYFENINCRVILRGELGQVAKIADLVEYEIILSFC
jgi:hypothetical protein